MRDEVWNLRSRRCFRAIGRAFAAGKDRFGFRLVHFSVQGNHLHIVVEAEDQASLSRGMQGLSIRLAKGLNRVMSRRGPAAMGCLTGMAVEPATPCLQSIQRRGLETGGRYSRTLYRCPVCGKFLTRGEYEKALRIHEAREEHFRRREAEFDQKLKELPKRIKGAADEARRKEKQRAERLVAGWRHKVATLEQRIRQLERGSTPQTEGLEFEEKLTVRLRREFPEDEIRHTGKGGDVVQVVRFHSDKAGVVVYECKRTPKIRADHIDQANSARQTRNADFCVLVTTGAKRGFSGLTQLNNVLIVSPLGVIPLAELLRRHLVELLRAKVTGKKRRIIAHRLMEYITSPQFRNPIEDVIDRSLQLQRMIKEEFDGHMRTWKKRWGHYQTIHWNGTHVQANVQRVLYGKIPKALEAHKALPLQLTGSTNDRQ